MRFPNSTCFISHAFHLQQFTQLEDTVTFCKNIRNNYYDIDDKRPSGRVDIKQVVEEDIDEMRKKFGSAVVNII